MMMMIFFFRGWKENEKTSCDVVVTLAFLMNGFLFSFFKFFVSFEDDSFTRGVCS